MGKSRPFPCSVPGCKKLQRARGYCCAHWDRWRKHGDPLGGRIPNGERVRFVQEEVLSYKGTDCLVWPFPLTTHGRAYFRIGGKLTSVSRYVCQHRHGPPPADSYHAAHSCGKGHTGCISPKHLSWKTPAENNADKKLHGTHQVGEQSPTAKISTDDAKQIISLRGKLTQREIGEMFGISSAHVCSIQRGTWWKHLDRKPITNPEIGDAE